MPATMTRRRTRRNQPIQGESLFHFCRHCEGAYDPAESEIEGVCNHCADTLYARCDGCHEHHLLEEFTHTEDGSDFCEACTKSLTHVCQDCGRVYEDAHHMHINDHEGRIICDSCAEGYHACECCGRVFLSYDMQATGNGWRCWNCAAYNTGRPIMAYSFKPEPIFHDVEGGTSNLFLGVELEMDHGNADVAAKRILAAYGEQDLLYFKRDGSLDDGCELVTHPISAEYMMSDAGKEMWQDICKSALAEGMRSHDTETCGLHVHVSREFFGKSGTAQELTELKLIELVDRLYEPFVLFSRRKRRNMDRWASKCNAPKTDEGWAKKAKRVSDFAKRDRYRAVNITNKNTIEFRMFRGTLKAETILATLQFVVGLCYLAKKLNPSQMDRICWYDLCDAVMESCPTDTTELYEYLVERELIVAKGI